MTTDTGEAGKQLLHIVLGGELEDIKGTEFRDLSKVDVVGLFPNYKSAYDAWKSAAQGSVDNAHMRYFIVHVHRLLDPETPAETRKLIWHFPYYHPEAGFSNAPPKIGIDDGITSQTRPHSVIQSDGWKLIHFYENSVDELFHLPSDLSEQIDRSQAEPVRAKRLHQELESVLSESNARLPIPNPDFPRKK